MAFAQCFQSAIEINISGANICVIIAWLWLLHIVGTSGLDLEPCWMHLLAFYQTQAQSDGAYLHKLA